MVFWIQAIINGGPGVLGPPFHLPAKKARTTKRPQSSVCLLFGATILKEIEDGHALRQQKQRTWSRDRGVVKPLHTVPKSSKSCVNFFQTIFRQPYQWDPLGIWVALSLRHLSNNASRDIQRQHNDFGPPGPDVFARGKLKGKNAQSVNKI